MELPIEEEDPMPLPKEGDPPQPLPIGDLCHDSAMPK